MGVPVRSCCCQSENKLAVFSHRQNFFGHHIVELTVRLSVKLIKDHTVNVKPVLGIGFGQDLIEAV